MQISRRALFGKLNSSLFKAMESATAYAKLKNQPYVEICHWLWHFIQLPSTDLQILIAHFKLDPVRIEWELRTACEQQPTEARGLIDFGQQILFAVERAWIQASLVNSDRKIRSAWLLAALLNDAQLRLALQSTAPTLMRINLSVCEADWNVLLDGSREQTERACDELELPSAIPGEASSALHQEKQTNSHLELYCTDFSEQARSGKLDAVIGREHEIRTMIDILLRRRQNNPLLTGEAGVGKTAVVEGLALAIANNEVPPALQNVKLLSLDVGALLAGASMRGEFEARLKQLLKEAQESDRPIILFIDEVHTLVGAGGQAGTGDAANLLKPALARGAIRTIGATTWSEFKKHIEKDPALTRRFQVLQVNEPEVAKAMAMVRSLVQTFATHHGVVIDNEAVEAAVQLSHRYIPARQLPDKAISLLDTACARVAMSQHALPSALLSCKAEIAQLQSRLSLCEKDLQRDSNQTQDLEAMKRQLTQLNEQEQLLEDRWELEKQLVQRLQQCWENPHQKDQAPILEQPDTLMLQQQLREFQGESPLVHAHVNASVVASVVADWTNIPVGKMLTSDREAVMQLQSQLTHRVKGQADALHTIVQRVQIAKASLSDPNKPVGVFMLVGPSGVGKTETALALAEAVYGGEHNLITLNMSEFQEPHTISSIKGSPPGYVGYGEGGVLTEAVRRRPYSVILLDEVEKAHPDVHELFYQVFDKGWMEDGEGRNIDFRNTLILLTSNTGAEIISQLCEDPALVPQAQTLADAVQPELRKVFPAAFLGRMSIVPYLPLSEQVVNEIVDVQINRVIARMQQQHQIELSLTSTAKKKIGQAAGSMEIGGRRIAQHIERHVLPVLSIYWLERIQSSQLAQRLEMDWLEGQGYSLKELEMTD